MEIMSIKPVEGTESLERILGAEGSGIIEETGSELANSNLKGLKVAFAYGAWSQFVIKDIDEVIVFKNKDLDAKLISNAFVNPLTALCLKEKLSNMSD
jgi:NADPH:quinone reductase-like Zn-dependent oxidoreductase